MWDKAVEVITRRKKVVGEAVTPQRLLVAEFDGNRLGFALERVSGLP